MTEKGKASAKKEYSWFSDKRGRIKKRAAKDQKYMKRITWIWALAFAVWVGIVFFAAEYVVFGIAQLIINLLPNANINVNLAQTLCMVASYVLALVVMILVPKKLFKMKLTRDDMGLRGMPTWTDILLSPVGYILSLIAGLAIMMATKALIPSINWNQTQDVGFNSVVSGADRLITFVALVILAPITEELIFRGFLYGKLRGHMSALPAIVIVSVLFGIMHGQVNVGIIVGIMSVFMCIAREITGTIYTGILMHMLRNGVAFYMLYIVGGTGIGAAAGAAIPLLLPFLV